MTFRTYYVVSLPVELWQEIFLLSYSLPILRLVCKLFNDIVVPTLFSHICISYKDNKLNVFLESLEALAIGTHPAIAHTKSITIKNIRPPLRRDMAYHVKVEKEAELRYQQEVLNPYNVHLDSIQTWFSAALGSLVNTTTAIWAVNEHDSDTWSRDCVISGITRMPSLKELILNASIKDCPIDLRTLPPLEHLTINGMYPGTSVGAHGTIRGIRELIAKSANILQRLDVQASEVRSREERMPAFVPSFLQDTPPMHLSHLSLSRLIPFSGQAIPHFRFLKSLCLMKIPARALIYKFSTSPRPIADLWNILKQAKIMLRDIAIDCPSETVSEYLKSYRGLKTLTNTDASGTSSQESDRCALKFFADGLYTHSNTLEILKITPMFEGKWCFGEHNARAISMLPSLRHLAVSIIADSTKTISWHSNYYPEKFPPEMEFNPLYPVCDLMRTVTYLPNLKLLSIHGADLSCNRNVQEPLIHRLAIPSSEQIHIHVTSFGPLNPSEYKYAIENFNKQYTLQRRESSGDYWYSTSTLPAL